MQTMVTSGRRLLLLRGGSAAIAAAAAAVAAAAGAIAQPGTSLAQGAGGDPAAFIQQLGDRLVATVNGPGSLEQKKAALQPMIEQAVDVDGIARFCLGRFWRSATGEQQAEYTRLFHRVLLDNIVGRMGEYRGVSFSMTGMQQREGEILVGTIIRRPNQRPVNVQWVVSRATGQPRIVDVVVEGTSLRLTQRSDYSAYVTRNGNSIDALIAAMRQQVGA